MRQASTSLVRHHAGRMSGLWETVIYRANVEERCWNTCFCLSLVSLAQQRVDPPPRPRTAPVLFETRSGICGKFVGGLQLLNLRALSRPKAPVAAHGLACPIRNLVNELYLLSHHCVLMRRSSKMRLSTPRSASVVQNLISSSSSSVSCTTSSLFDLIR